MSLAFLDDPALRDAFDLLAGGGHRAWAVGGAVRDALLGRPVADIDLATDAPPARVLALAAACGLRAIPTGIEHGTVTLVLRGRPYEVTTLRRDVETHGRRARVEFGASIDADARRRDFTINALYATPAGEILDPVGGLEDLRARRLRFVGDAAARLAEDHLRSLRYFRFHAELGLEGFGAEELAAIAGALDGLDSLSRERVGAEMRRLLAAPDPGPALATMGRLGVLSRLLPGADPAAVPPLVDREAHAGVPPDWLRRLAALGGEEPAARLRLSRAEARRLARLRDAAAAPAPAHELGFRLGGPEATDALLLRAAALGRSWDPAEGEAAAEGAAARFPLSAADLAPLAGPALGERLGALEAAWLGSRFRLTRDELLALL